MSHASFSPRSFVARRIMAFGVFACMSVAGIVGMAIVANAHNGVDHSKQGSMPRDDHEAHSGHTMPESASADIPEHEKPFLAKNAAAMDKMMADMNVAPTGDIDRDFVVMKVPHHQGAIDMCAAYLPYAGNTQLKRLCQEIIVTQQQEIVAMYLAIGAELPPSAPASTR